MVAWYKHDIPAWMDGTESLSDGAYRAYHVVVQMIYLNGGPITLNERGIAGRCRQHVLKFRNCLKELVDAGKLSLVDDKIHNGRAARELSKLTPNLKATSEQPKTNPEPTPDLPTTYPEATYEQPTPGFNGKPLKYNGADTSVASLDKIRREKKREERISSEKSDEFDCWYKIYPRHEGRGQALRAYKNARKKATAEELLAGARRAVDRYETVETRFIPLPATWLNGERWLDEPASSTTVDDPYRGAIY